MAEQARSEKSEESLGSEVLVVGMATERALRHGVIWRKTSHGTAGRERLRSEISQMSVDLVVWDLAGLS
jgi:hypothetical protein